MVIVADSAYQSNEDETDCIVLRGWLTLLTCDRTEAQQKKDFPGGAIQLIDFTSKKLQVISRSAFAAEMKNALEAAQDGINHAVLLYEIVFGVVAAENCAEIRDSASYSPPIDVHLCTDSDGLFTATTKQNPAPGTDQSMLFHVQALRKLLDGGNLKSLLWIDNRDMLADGLTKGLITRSFLNDALSKGEWLLNQQKKEWEPKQRTNDRT